MTPATRLVHTFESFFFHLPHANIFTFLATDSQDAPSVSDRPFLSTNSFTSTGSSTGSLTELTIQKSASIDGKDKLEAVQIEPLPAKSTRLDTPMPKKKKEGSSGMVKRSATYPIIDNDAITSMTIPSFLSTPEAEAEVEEEVVQEEEEAVVEVEEEKVDRGRKGSLCLSPTEEDKPLKDWRSSVHITPPPFTSSPNTPQSASSHSTKHAGPNTSPFSRPSRPTSSRLNNLSKGHYATFSGSRPMAFSMTREEVMLDDELDAVIGDWVVPPKLDDVLEVLLFEL